MLLFCGPSVAAIATEDIIIGTAAAAVAPEVIIGAAAITITAIGLYCLQNL